jgi:hypothetical protein
MPSSRGQQPTPSSSLSNNLLSASTSSSSNNNWRLTMTPQINGNASWKTNNRTVLTSRTLPSQQQQQQQTVTQIRMYSKSNIILSYIIRMKIFTEQINRE